MCVCHFIPAAQFSAIASLPASDNSTHVPRRMLFCDSNCLCHKVVQEVAPAFPRVPGRAWPISHPVSRNGEKKLVQFAPPSQLWKVQPPWPCSALSGLPVEQEQGELPLGGCHASVLCSAWRRRHPPPGPHGSLTATGAKSQRKNDTGAGDGGCPRCSCQAHHLHERTSSSVGPICSLDTSTAGA